jgi:Na+-translocating ferredoxin:NAD+ oxidoreductase subunit A
MNEYFILVVGAVLVNNVVLSRFLGICPLLGVSKKLDTALGMSGAVLFVMTLASLVTASLYHLVLIENAIFCKADLTYLRTIVFIVVIASLVQLVEVILQRVSPALYRALGIYLPLITTNCAVLGIAVDAADNKYSIIKSTAFGTASALAFALALVLFSSLREKLDLARVPKCMEGTAIALVTAGLLAMAFMGFSGLVGG